MGTLTVRENIMFSANLRLRGEHSYDEKCRKVDKVIRRLGLSFCANSVVEYFHQFSFSFHCHTRGLNTSCGNYLAKYFKCFKCVTRLHNSTLDINS